ncbi:lysophospholipid acyltransferase family protein [Sandaracinus amylolyticus]|uniref:1-acyl-sn-glycerol-3-phosphate acyltransferase n=1 Tax=Sandaracinus amylolyticus TaxID=927083 RepID=A0A0F6YLT3_9BACT|nr:lysophospholipid acyltransferase family protein [Sandaracinus amylolyticus]AKF09557.1 1-acyl-sn-glycerol-3-phosphate acyltransferase [Sandaracinus amylolyticus]
MPRWLRIILTAWAFFLFFVGSPLIGIVVLPLLRLVAKDREDHRRRCTRVIGRLHRVFTWWMRVSGLVAPPAMPELPGVAPGAPYVMITNHPSLIDVILLLGSFEGLTCVVKGSWYRSLVLGPLLKQTAYLPGPGSGEEESEDMLGTMVEHLSTGHPLLVFPEGTRSLKNRMHRFRRGAVEAAVRAKVPIVAMFVAIDRPFLMKGVPFWHVPKDTATYSIEPLEVIDTRDVPVEHAKALNAELQSKFQARFQRMLAERVEHAVRPSAPPPQPRADRAAA